MIHTSTQHPSVPRSITRLAREHHLGRRRAAYGYGADLAALSNILITPLVARLVSIVPFGVAGILIWSIYRYAIINPSAYVGAAILLVLGVSILLFTNVGKRRLSKRLAASWLACVYTAGCIIQPYNQDAQIFRWEEIEALWLGYSNSRLDSANFVESLRILRADGYELTLTRAGGALNRLAEIANAHLSERLMSHILAQYSTGQTVVFGPCGVNQEGFSLLEQGGKMLSWTCFARSEIKEKCLQIGENGQKLPWASIPTATIPNLALLVELVDLVHAGAI